MDEDEFVEDEIPASGTSVVVEIRDHYGLEAWWSYAVEPVLRQMRQLRQNLWWLFEASSSRTGPPDEFQEDEVPLTGLPPIRPDYPMPPLPRFPDE
jgi:hypothetical protein